MSLLSIFEFLELLITSLITIIRLEINKYSHHTKQSTGGV